MQDKDLQKYIKLIKFFQILKHVKFMILKQFWVLDQMDKNQQFMINHMLMFCLKIFLKFYEQI
jgi:hypothetical protein